jgi:hypothetical protein
MQKHIPTIIVAAASFVGALIGSGLRRSKKEK